MAAGRGSRRAAGALVAQSAPPIKVLRTIKPVKLTKPRSGLYVFDFGQNFGGWVRLRVQGPAGTAVTITAGELLAADGTVNALTSAAGQIKQGGASGGPGAPANAFQPETYVLCGKGQEVFTPHFTFHGFRYVQLSGYPGQPTLDSINGLQLGAAVEPCGSFTCSNAMLNQIQEMVRQTFLSNLFSMESDCPHREKFGYGGDIVAAAETAVLNFDMATFYAKTVRDLQDAVRAMAASPRPRRLWASPTRASAVRAARSNGAPPTRSCSSSSTSATAIER